MTIIKNAIVYDPYLLGVKDILIEGDKIIAIANDIFVNSNALQVEVIDAAGKIVLPGYIDQHVHVIGGGGEAGFKSRTPEVVLSDIVKAGVTTVIGVLGTDATTRSLESLLAKVRALDEEGVSAYMLTGAYEVPIPTLFADARRDIILIDKILGVGEVAISDHRSSLATFDEIKRIVTQARVGGMLSGKAGVIQFHVGDGNSKLSMLFDIIDQTEVPACHLIPTHVNRSKALLTSAMDFAKKGGYIDITSCMGSADMSASKAIRMCSDYGVPISQITMSSDGNGSQTKYDALGKVTGLTSASMATLHAAVKAAITKEKVPAEDVFAIVTKNVAKANGLWPHKGAIAIGSDADLLFLTAAYDICDLMAKGKFMIRDKKLLTKGTFE
ncbi:beta-aspartyl-peptidase [Candidatus Epulonipiscium viviparus]|uniref:beta-aspartyl-peptidase n=1 Tax=Candidatus Epulonipiscium viviparus TaxID=420336 RepID=UPI0027380955|nr:beta-aspartyl-peptidase [Candidatus Epulopiscium viviparus]